MALAPIVYNVETIGSLYAPSLNTAFRELYAASGIKPRVLSPLGGARTVAEQQALIDQGKSNTLSSDHVKQRAADIDNHRDIRNRIGNPRFEAILNRNGWENVQVNGDPFPTEPWHWANQASTPAGGVPVPLTSRSEMNIIQITKNDVNDPAWPLGQYLVKENGVTRTTAAIAKSVHRINGRSDWAAYQGTPQYSGEVRNLDATLRATTPQGGDIDEDALATALAPLLSGVSEADKTAIICGAGEAARAALAAALSNG